VSGATFIVYHSFNSSSQSFPPAKIQHFSETGKKKYTFLLKICVSKKKAVSLHAFCRLMEKQGTKGER